MKEGKRSLDKEPPPKYNYFAKPDGEDVAQKLWYVLKPAAAASLALGTIDVMLKSQPKGYGNIMARYAYIGLPIIGCSTVFVIASNFIGAVRNKQDTLNWVAAGMLSGSVVGAWKRSHPAGYTAAAVFGFAAYVKKAAVKNNYTFFPEIRSFTSHRCEPDYTITKNIPGNYTWSTK